MPPIQKMLGSPGLIIISLISIIIIVLCIYLYFSFSETSESSETNEGFYPVNDSRIKFEEVGKRRYNDLSDMNDPEKDGVIPNGKLGDKVVNNLLNTPTYEGDINAGSLSGPNFVNELPYKTPPANSEVLERIKMCERLESWDCSALSDPVFSKHCGICSDKGQTHLGKAHIGGLYIDPDIKARDSAEAAARGEVYKPIPTSGRCAGEFVTERPHCDTQKDRDECSKAQGFKDQAAMAKCALCANAPGGNLFVYVGKREGVETNYKMIGNPVPFKVRLRFAVTHPSEAEIFVTRSSDQKKFIGSYIPNTNTYIVDLPNAKENEKYNILVKYPDYVGHEFTAAEENRITDIITPKFAALARASYGPRIDGENGFLEDDVRAVDVSDYVKNKYKIMDCSKTAVTVTPDALGGDVSPGLPKQLRLTYSNNGVDFAYAYGTDGQITAPVNTKSFATLCPPLIKKEVGEQQVCENDVDGNVIAKRIYTAGNNKAYYGVASTVRCIETAKPKDRGIVGIWESLGRVARIVPLDITVKTINGYEVGEEGVRTLGTISGSSYFKKLVGKGQALGIPPNLFWFWAKKSKLNTCDFSVQVPALLRDPSIDEDLKLCPTGPLITTEEAAKNLNYGACEKLINGVAQGPGNYSDECVRSLYLSSGCTKDGLLFPNTPKKTQTFTKDSITQAENDIDTISDKINEMYTIASTGMNADGLQMEQSSYAQANLDCFGIKITNPCDTVFKDTGPHKPECLDYLFKNAGKDNPKIGQTYPGMFNRSSGTDRKVDTPIMFCQRTGSLSPIGADGKLNDDAIAEANSYGSVTSVREFYKQIHFDANLGRDPIAQQRALSQCYGVGVRTTAEVCKGLTGRFIVIRPSMKNDNYIQISQIEVYNVNSELVSVGMITKSSTPYPQTNTKKPVDGRSAVREYPDLFIANNDISINKTESFWEVDLGKSVEISYIVYYNRASSQQRSIGMRVQLLDENRVLVKQHALKGGPIETVLFSNIKPAGLLRTGENVSLAPSKYAGSSITIMSGGEVIISPRTNTSAASYTFVTLPGNTPKAGSFSFKHAGSERYLRVQGFRVRVAEDDGTNAFKQETSFIVSDSLTGNPGEVSYESVSTPGSYLGVADNMGVYITKADSNPKKKTCSWLTTKVA
jgi:hypothetical protein